MSDVVSNPLHMQLTEEPGLREVFCAILDRFERSGRMPRSLTLDVAPKVERALAVILGGRAVRRTRAGRVKLSFDGAHRGEGLGGEGLGGEGLAARLYEALEREPVSEEPRRATARALEATLHQLDARTSVSVAFVEFQIGVLRGGPRSPADDPPDLFELALERGLAPAQREAARVVQIIDALLANDQVLRVPTFSTRVLGASKALRWNGETFRRAGAAIYDHEPGTRAEVEAQFPSRRRLPTLVFESWGVYQDTTAASVLCFGPLVYRKEARTFDHGLQHARLGEPVRLTVAQLRGAAVDAVERVWLVENLTPFLDLVDIAQGPSRQHLPAGLLVCTGGQASWAVVSLVRKLAKHGVPMLHAGDLDRSGVHILRSLRRRTGAKIAPWFMDDATHERFRERGLPLSAAEKRRLGKLLRIDPPMEPAHDLLHAVSRSGIWIEQEAFSDETLVPDFAKRLDAQRMGG